MIDWKELRRAWNHLSLSKKMMETMGGRIGFTSAEGNGSTFWVEFPVSETSIETAKDTPLEVGAEGLDAAVTANGLADRMVSILYVEDNPTNMELMKAIVARIPNTHLVEATTAEQGLEIATQQTPDVIILDINLPDMNGLSAMRRLKEDGRTKDIPVLALSADAMPETISEGIEAGFMSYLTKPVDLSQLVTALTDSLRSQE